MKTRTISSNKIRKGPLVTAAVAVALIQLPFAAQAQLFLKDFSSNGTFNFLGNTWSTPGNVVPGPSFITFTGTSTENGIGTLWTGPTAVSTVDWSSYGLANLEIAVTIQLDPSNTADNIRVGLRSGAGNQWLWNIPTSNFNTSSFTTFTINLGTPPVSTSGVPTLATLDRVIFQGDLGTADFRMQLQEIRVNLIPEPAVVLAVSLIVLLAGAILLKRKTRALAARKSHIALAASPSA